MARKSGGAGNGNSGAEIDLGGPVSEIASDPDSASGGTDAGTEGFVNPASVGENGSDPGGQPRRGRGRPKGSGRKAQTETVRSLGVDGVAGILVSVHSMLAAISKSPELELSEDEAAKIAKAAIAVADLYDLQTTKKATAWANLMGCLGAAYIPRFVSVNVRKKMEAAERKANPNVTQFPGQRIN